MQYLALATDYDGTLAHDGQVAPNVIQALEKVSASGRKLILVTGRELTELMSVFPQLAVFDIVIAENGALMYIPAIQEQRKLGERPPEIFIHALSQRGVQPLSIGKVIVATWQPHEVAVLEVIKDLGMELTISFNKGAVMILPSGINKATGLEAALLELGIDSTHVVGVGDGENDHAFLKTCGVSVATQNAVPMLQEEADVVLGQRNGDGVATLARDLVEHDLESYEIGLKTRKGLRRG